jgi:hypothetical protein
VEVFYPLPKSLNELVLSRCKLLREARESYSRVVSEDDDEQVDDSKNEDDPDHTRRQMNLRMGKTALVKNAP